MEPAEGGGPWSQLGGLWSQLGSPETTGRPGRGMEKKPVAKRHQMVSGSLALPYCFFIVSFLAISMEAGQKQVL